MKISKYFMVAAASIMMFGCAKEDNNGPKFDGPVALSIKIAAPELNSKAAVDPTATAATTITYEKVKVKLNAASGDNVNTWVELDAEQVDPSGEGYTFWNVETPQSVEVSINGGAATYNDLTAFTGVPATDVPVYGKSSNFTFVGTATNNGTQYDEYEITVNAKIPVARLELSGIQHKAHAEGKECKYSALTLDKITIMDAVIAGVYNEETNVFDGTAASTDDLEETVEALETTGNDFLAAGAVFPVTGKCYAFNMFSGMPKVRFDGVCTTKDGRLTDASRYAFVTKFVNSDTQEEIISFLPGNIYRMTSIEIPDDAYTSDPEGNTLVAVTVFVTVQPWTVVNTSVEF